ncbi:Adenosylhomocysteinase [hydrothermal vent metagenome]|uniref:Adenosylhomocysteinase n=1 Tax=hydrothermal vent metagenome TaxID=652676 RepID=A0A3B0Z915_9ZZZZ
MKKGSIQYLMRSTYNLYISELSLMHLNQKDVATLLQSHQPASEKEKKDTKRTIEFVQSTSRFWQRNTLPGHLTASAWVVDMTYCHAVLVHHKKLNQWFQPGGHIENDSDILAAAKREAIEETGIKQLKVASTHIFDIDVHLIPEKKSMPQHWHFDIRFAFLVDVAIQLQVSDESHDVRWVLLTDLTKLNNDASITRMVEKTQRLSHINDSLDKK